MFEGIRKEYFRSFFSALWDSLTHYDKRNNFIKFRFEIGTMNPTPIYYYDPHVGSFHYGPMHPMKPHRNDLTRALRTTVPKPRTLVVWDSKSDKTAIEDLIKRIQVTHSLVLHYNLHKKMNLYRPRLATKSDLCTFHSQEYIDFLSRVTTDNMSSYTRELEKFSVGLANGDTPLFGGRDLLRPYSHFTHPLSKLPLFSIFPQVSFLLVNFCHRFLRTGIRFYYFARY